MTWRVVSSLWSCLLGTPAFPVRVDAKKSIYKYMKSGTWGSALPAACLSTIVLCAACLLVNRIFIFVVSQGGEEKCLPKSQAVCVNNDSEKNIKHVSGVYGEPASTPKIFFFLQGSHLKRESSSLHCICLFVAC